MSYIAGIDGCPKGWLAVFKDVATGDCKARILSNICELLEFRPRLQVAMVDVPIGLTDAGQRGCDRQARSLLGRPRSSSVFSAPIRPMLDADSYQSACNIGERIDGRKLSKQSWAIVNKIKEVDTFLQSDISNQSWLREVHPEVCFWLWNNENSMAFGKKTAAGKAERELLVRARYASAYEAAINHLPRRDYSRDDLLDAFSALWTAERLVAGQAKTISAGIDSTGLRIEMIA